MQYPHESKTGGTSAYGGQVQAERIPISSGDVELVGGDAGTGQSGLRTLRWQRTHKLRLATARLV